MFRNSLRCRFPCQQQRQPVGGRRRIAACCWERKRGRRRHPLYPRQCLRRARASGGHLFLDAYAREGNTTEGGRRGEVPLSPVTLELRAKVGIYLRQVGLASAWVVEPAPLYHRAMAGRLVEENLPELGQVRSSCCMPSIQTSRELCINPKGG